MTATRLLPKRCKPGELCAPACRVGSLSQFGRSHESSSPGHHLRLQSTRPASEERFLRFLQLRGRRSSGRLRGGQVNAGAQPGVCGTANQAPSHGVDGGEAGFDSRCPQSVVACGFPDRASTPSVRPPWAGGCHGGEHWVCPHRPALSANRRKGAITPRCRVALLPVSLLRLRLGRHRGGTPFRAEPASNPGRRGRPRLPRESDPERLRPDLEGDAQRQP